MWGWSMPFSEGRDSGAARGVRLASLEPGFTARRSPCFGTADAKVCSSLATGGVELLWDSLTPGRGLGDSLLGFLWVYEPRGTASQSK